MMSGAALTLHISGLSVRTPEQQTGDVRKTAEASVSICLISTRLLQQLTLKRQSKNLPLGLALPLLPASPCFPVNSTKTELSRKYNTIIEIIFLSHSPKRYSIKPQDQLDVAL